MKQIRLSEYGHHLSSRSRANELRCEVLASFANGNQSVTIDLAGVVTLSDSFADELFAVIVAEQGENWFRKHIHVINASEPVRESILQTVQYRLYRPSVTSDVGLTPPPARIQKVQTL
jgi:hypothetical protein